MFSDHIVLSALTTRAPGRCWASHSLDPSAGVDLRDLACAQPGRGDRSIRVGDDLAGRVNAPGGSRWRRVGPSAGHHPTESSRTASSTVPAADAARSQVSCSRRRRGTLRPGASCWSAGVTPRCHGPSRTVRADVAADRGCQGRVAHRPVTRRQLRDQPARWWSRAGLPSQATGHDADRGRRSRSGLISR